MSNKKSVVRPSHAEGHQRAMKDRSEVLEKILSATHCHVFLTDRSGRIQYASEAGAKILGLRPEKIIGQTWEELGLEPDRISRLVMQTEEIFLTKTPVRGEVDYPVQGNVMTFEYSISPVLGDDGTVEYTVATVVDVTTRKTMESELRTIDEVTRIATSTLNLNDMLRSLIKKLMELTKADSGSVLLRERDKVYITASVGLGDQVPAPIYTEIWGGFSGRVVERRESQYIEDAQSDPIVNPFIRSKGIRSILGVPLMDKGVPIGTLIMHWNNRHPRNEQEIRLLTIVADRCVSAIVNARLYERTVEEERFSDALNKINASINSTLDIHELMERAVAEGAIAMGSESAAIDIKEDRSWVTRYVYGMPREAIGTKFPEQGSPFVALAARTGSRWQSTTHWGMRGWTRMSYSNSISAQY